MFEQRDPEALMLEEFRVEKKQSPAVKGGTFHRKLDETFPETKFAGKVRDLCRAAYKKERRGLRRQR